jgi:hypothetical protein
MNQFWNRLVELDNKNRAEWHSVFMCDPEYAKLKQQADELTAAIDALWVERRQVRAKLRKRSTPEDAEFKTQIDSLAATRRQLWASMKTERNRIKAALKTTLENVELQHKLRITQARRETGLWWCNYNAVFDSYLTARTRSLKGGAELRPHHFDGSGRFAVQIQGGKTLSQLINGESSLVRLERPSKEAFMHLFGDRPQSDDFWLLTITIYTYRDADGKLSRRNLTFPLYLSREIPERFENDGEQLDVLIKSVEVVCRKRDSLLYFAPEDPKYGLISRPSMPNIADKFEWACIFTCVTPKIDVASESVSACGVNFGWRQTKNGIRIATVVGTDGACEHYYLSEHALNLFYRAEQLQSELDESANIMRDRIADWLEVDDSHEEWKQLAQKAVNSTSPSLLHLLTLAWRDWPDFHPEWHEELEAWRNVKNPGKNADPASYQAFYDCDMRKRQQMIGLRRRALNHRLYQYQLLAKDLAKRYAIIGTGQLDLKSAAKLVINDTEENLLPEAARQIRQKTALSQLTMWTRTQSVKFGADIRPAKRPVTDTCHSCGKKQPLQPNEIVHVCTKCKTVYDRDENAAQIALQDAIC